MPYRQLPSTIISRNNVLEKTNQKVSSTAPEKWAITSETQTALSTLYPKFRQEMAERQEQFAAQSEATKAENAQQQVLLRFVSHFFRVFNFAVERRKYKASDRLYYGLNANQSELPKISSEQDLVTWAKNLLAGEEKRMSHGNPNAEPPVAMSNPGADEVQVELDKYTALSNAQSAEKMAFDAENKDVLDMLPEIDELIRDIYDEVEFYYRRETPANRRKLAREWGVVYVSRPGEDPEDELEE